MIKKVLISAIIAISFCACDQISQANYGKTPVLETNGEILYYEDILEAMPEGLNPQDSAKFADSYIQRWATNTLLYEKAARNVSNKQQINELVEDFRRQLVINQYKQQIVESKIKTVSEDSIAAYYEANKNKYPLPEAVVKGVLLKIPQSSPRQDDLREWLKELNDENLDEIMRYCTQNALSCDFFNETWEPYSKISKKLPEKIDSNDPKLTRDIIRQEQGNAVYYLRLSGHIKAGSPMPLEMASPEIQNMMLNKQKVNIIKNYEQNLYEDAIENGKIKQLSTEQQ